MTSVLEGVKKVVGEGARIFNVEEKREGTMMRATGCPIGNSKSSLSAGPLGPTLLQDVELLEKLQHFDREKIPPRNVHALGNGAHGTLTITHDITRYSKAKVFGHVGKQTPIFVRFSGIFTEQGEADTTRDPRGFAIKFYTEEGNWDLLAINTPVFAVREAKLGPDCVHAFKRDPRSFEWNDVQFWDYVVSHPEAWHQTLMIYTDRGGTPLSYRYMHGYGCNTFSLINSENKRVWVKFHILTETKARGLTDDEAKLIAGVDPDWLKRDLREAIERGDYPRWRFAMQVMPEEEGYRNPIAFDCTKVWPHSQYPLIDIGTIELNRNPIDYFAEVEQVAFSPANVVPGIGFSPDKMLQGRLLIYSDSQFHRLGPNYLQIPINCPLGVSTVQTNYIGGAHQHEVQRKWPHYYPSQHGGLHPVARHKQPVIPIHATAADFYEYPHEGTDEDYYSQPRALLEELDETEMEHLVTNLARSLACVKDDKVVSLVIEQLSKISNRLGAHTDALRRDIISDKAKSSVGCDLWQQLRQRLIKKQIY